MRLFFLLLIILPGARIFAQPSISSFTPVSGPVGTTVTFNGSGFSPTTAGNIVYFGAVKAAVTNASPTVLRVIVPIGATYQPITVTTNNLTAYAAEPFIITFNGCGTFSSASFAPAEDAIVTQSFLNSLALNDLDGDGKPDMVIADIMNGISFSRNTSGIGNISFSPAVIPDPNLKTDFFDLSDLDGDGKADVCASFDNTNNVFFLRNTSTPGGISFGNTTSYALPEAPLGIKAGDLDGDGKPDVVVTHPDVNNKLYILQNTSASGAISFTQLPPLVAARLPYNIWIGDIDGDGKPELAVTNADNASFSVYPNTSTPGNISFAPRIDFPTGSSPRGIAGGDLDGDGRPEIVVCNAQSNTLSVYVNKSTSGNISFLPQMNLVAGNYPNNVALTDMNGDGKPDILAKNLISGDLFLYQNSGSPGNVSFFTPANYSMNPVGFVAAAADVDGNGKPDMVTVTSNHQAVTVFRNLFVRGPKVNVDTVAATCNNRNGTIIATGNGGLAPLRYSLADTNFQTGNTFNSLEAGTYIVKVKDANGCIDSMPAVIRQTGNPSIQASPSNTSCSAKDGNITVTATLGTPPYLFSKDDVVFQPGNIFSNLDSGSYKISVKDANGCTDSIPAVIWQTAKPSIQANASNSSCSAKNGNITVTATLGTPPYLFSKDNILFQPGNVFSNLDSGSYTISVKDASGCVSDTVIAIRANCVTLTATASADTCEKGIASINALASTGTAPYQYSINGIDFQDTGWFSGLKAGSYTVIVKDAANAADTAIVTVDNTGTPVSVNSGDDIAVCQGEKTHLQATSNGTGFSWMPQRFLSDPAVLDPEAFPDATTVYTITANNGICTGTDSVTVFVNPAPHAFAGNDTTAFINQPLQLNGTDLNNSGMSTYSWWPANGLNNTHIANPIATPGNDITYLLTITTVNGCAGTARINIKVFSHPEIYVPTAFTPNSDERNDILKARPVGLKEFRLFSIYNRLGELVFSTTDAGIGWNGIYQSKAQPADIYVWIAEGVSYNGTIIRRKGTVALLR